MAGKKNKSLKVVLVILMCLILATAIGIGIYFARKNAKIKYYEVSLSSNTGEISLSTESKSLSPFSTIINRPVVVNISKESSPSYIRAKIIFETDSLDDRMQSFVSQLNYKIANTATHEGDNYKWIYEKGDNSFYLANKNDTLRTVVNKDDDFTFLKTLKVPSDLEQIQSLNSDGNNVQVGEDVVIKIVFESIQSELMLNKNPKIKDVQSYFNNFSTNYEDGFTSVNGYITSCTKTDKEIVLPRYIGDDYIIGVKQNAFQSSTLEKIIIPGNYIFFEENCFSNCSSLNFVAIRNYTKIQISSNSFAQKVSLEIFTPESLSSFLKENYGALTIMGNLKTFTEVTSSDISLLNTSAEYLYCPNVEEFSGTFKSFNRVKVIDFPSLKKINEEMFAGLSSLTFVNCPNAQVVEKNAFSNCTGLVSVILDKKLEQIGENSFMNCQSLKNIDFISNLAEIPSQSFRNCDNIVRVNIKANDIKVGASAFYGCDNLKYVELNKVEQIDNYAFSTCVALRYIKINDYGTNLSLESETIEGSTNAVFVFEKSELKSSFAQQYSTYKTMLMQITDNALVRYDGSIRNLDLTEFSFVNKIYSISDGAFKDNTILETLILPTTISSVGKEFVSGCEKLKTITINSSKAVTFSENCFDETNNNLSVKVPSYLVDLCKESLKGYDVTVLSI